MLPEMIGVRFIYYEKVKDGINVFFESHWPKKNNVKKSSEWQPILSPNLQ
jgi:hypothetical protein